MNIEIAIYGEPAGSGVVGEGGDLIGIEWCNGWFGVDRIKRIDLPMLADQGMSFREDRS